MGTWAKLVVDGLYDPVHVQHFGDKQLRRLRGARVAVAGYVSRSPRLRTTVRVKNLTVLESPQRKQRATSAAPAHAPKSETPTHE